MRELRQILSVEDEPDIREVIRLSLELIGKYQVLMCPSGAEAVETLADHDPDLILLDVMMPGLDGPSTLLEIRRRYPEKKIPVIFMTAKVQPQEVASLFSMGAIGVISKPFDPASLATQIRGYWNGVWR